MDASLTVAEIFKNANLSPRGPVRWGTQVSESGAGIYVVARVGDATVGCKACALPFIDFANPYDNLKYPLSPLDLDLEYERKRWLPNEPVLYIGKTDRPIHKRVGEFYRHKCGDTSPHAGGQVVKLFAVRPVGLLVAGR